MTKVFDELAVIGDTIGENDRVVYLLKNQPDLNHMMCYSTFTLTLSSLAYAEEP